MKKIFIALLLVVSLVASAQKIGLSKSTVDFGDIPMKPKSTKDVTLYNRSDKPVVILDSKVDCSCTKAEWTKKPILKGDSTIIKVVYSPLETGVFYKKLTIITSSGNADVIVRGRVR